MRGRVQVLIFALVLGGLFAGAAAVGSAVGPIERGSNAGGDHAREMEVSHGPAGLAVAEEGFRLVPMRTVLTPDRQQIFAFRVVDSSGRAVRTYDELHERRMHLIVVRRDLTGFQHLHPALRPEGIWATTVKLADPGSYRAFADFSSGGRRAVLGVDFAVPGGVQPRALSAPSAHSRTGDGYDVVLQTRRIASERRSTLSFRVLRDGKSVQVGEYLGARGHLVVLREGDLGYLHTHPEDNELKFETTFPSAGRYRAFLQFAHDTRVHTATFTLQVRQ